jgi:hypothetical protein
VDHLDTVLKSDLDDLVASEISTNGGVLATLANDVRFIGLCVAKSASVLFVRQNACCFGNAKSLTLPVHAKAVLITEDVSLVESKLGRGCC